MIFYALVNLQKIWVTHMKYCFFFYYNKKYNIEIKKKLQYDACNYMNNSFPMYLCYVLPSDIIEKNVFSLSGKCVVAMCSFPMCM